MLWNCDGLRKRNHIVYDVYDFFDRFSCNSNDDKMGLTLLQHLTFMMSASCSPKYSLVHSVSFVSPWPIHIKRRSNFFLTFIKFQ